MSILLSVDWDYFFPSGEKTDKWALWDWGHSEKFGAELLQVLWQSRAVGFRHYKMDLPDTSGEELTFWNRFKFSDDCKLFVGDSHKGAIRPEVSLSIFEVWNYDAHADCGYHKDALKNIKRDQRVACEDWMLGYNIVNALDGSDLHVRYPSWRDYAMTDEPKPSLKGVDRQVDDQKPVDIIFDRIFIARSGAWVPPWLDDKWERFIDDCPVQPAVIEDGMTMNRGFDELAVQQELGMRDQLLKMNEATE